MPTKKKKKSNYKRYDVDIITPVYGQANFLDKLSVSLLDTYDAGVDFHWIIIDDATPEDKGATDVLKVMARLKERENVTTIQNKVNGGFAKANNLAVAKGRAKYILMLNSDTEIMEDGWLAQMISNIEENPLVGIVGARLLFFNDYSDDPARPSGMVQHAGVGFNFLGQPYHIFVGWPPEHPKVMEKRVMHAMTGACLLTTRKVWKHVGGLQEIYTTGNFEDVEFCVHVVASGYAVVYDPKVVLRHYAGGSGNTPTAIRNHQIFQLRNSHLVAWDDWNYF